MEEPELRAHLVESLARPSYGATAEEVLSTCRVVAQAEGTFRQRDLYVIRNEAKVSEQVWKRMCAVAKNETLWVFREKLPCSFSALYRLILLDEAQLIISVSDKSITPETTTRDIEKISKRARLNSRYRLSKRQIYFFAASELGEDELSNLLEEINYIAKGYRACFDTEDLEQLRKNDEKYQYDNRLAGLVSLLRQDIENFGIIEKLDETIEDDDDRREARNRIIDSSFRDFVDTLSSIACGREFMMKEYGFLYCTKIIYEYWRTDSRSQRYNYKRRLKEVRDKYPKVEEETRYLVENYMDI